jgi:hypothetical protein
MRLVKEYEQYAEQCRKLANTALKEHRLAIMDMADVWKRLAEERKKAVMRMATGADRK